MGFSCEFSMGWLSIRPETASTPPQATSAAGSAGYLALAEVIFGGRLPSQYLRNANGTHRQAKTVVADRMAWGGLKILLAKPINDGAFERDTMITEGMICFDFNMG